MSKLSKQQFIDKVVTTLSLYLPQASDEVRYFIACQFALESKFGTSALATYFNNYCGMKSPSVRLTLDTAASNGFAHYDTFTDCVFDYILWLSYNKFTYHDVFHLNLFKAKLIAKGYCPEKDYLDKITSLFNQLNS